MLLHMTPASSEWVQSCMDVYGQSNIDISVPVQAKSSIQISPLPSPYCTTAPSTALPL